MFFGTVRLPLESQLCASPSRRTNVPTPFLALFSPTMTEAGGVSPARSTRTPFASLFLTSSTPISA
jgi:hypothetical protein